MSEIDNYPLGADSRPDAPWKEEPLPEKEIEVLVSITLSKSVKIKVSDYEIIDSGKDEDDNYFEDIDYSNCDLKGAVEEQITLPYEIYTTSSKLSKFEKDITEDLKDWNVDEFEVMLD